MARKKEKTVEMVSGLDFAYFQGYDRWIAFKSGDKRITISSKMLFDIFDTMDFTIEKYGKRYRVIDWDVRRKKSKDVKSPQEENPAEIWREAEFK
jgi:hypothetical protein